jgi:hypothetical protein
MLANSKIIKRRQEVNKIWIIEHWWNDNGTESTQRETCHCTILSLVSPTWNALGLKPSLRLEEPATSASVLARPEQDRKVFKLFTNSIFSWQYKFSWIRCNHRQKDRKAENTSIHYTGKLHQDVPEGLSTEIQATAEACGWQPSQSIYS